MKDYNASINNKTVKHPPDAFTSARPQLEKTSSLARECGMRRFGPNSIKSSTM